MGQTSVSDDAEAVSVLKHIHESNCGMFGLPESTNTDDIADFRPALLKFMATATPDSKVAADIIDRFDHHKDSMLVTPTSHFAPSGGQHVIEFTADNVPDSVNPVKAKLAYVQVPNEARDGTELHLVWKVCIILLRSLKTPS